MTIRVRLTAGEERLSKINLSWEGDIELSLSVGPLIRGRFLCMDIAMLNALRGYTDVVLKLEESRYELIYLSVSGAFEAIRDDGGRLSACNLATCAEKISFRPMSATNPPRNSH